MSGEKKKPLGVYHIKEFRAGNEMKHWWNRVGRAFMNKDGSFNIFLSSVPVGENGEIKLHMREITEKPGAAVGAEGMGGDFPDYGNSFASEPFPGDQI